MKTRAQIQLVVLLASLLAASSAAVAADGPMQIPADKPEDAKPLENKDQGAPGDGGAEPGKDAAGNAKPDSGEAMHEDSKTTEELLERRKKAEKEGAFRPFTPEGLRPDAKNKGDPGMMGLPWPKSPEEANKTVESLLANLSTLDDHSLARQVAVSIERLWRAGAGDTVNLLMDRAEFFASRNEMDKALELLDAVVDLAPDYSEAWNRHAFANYRLGNQQAALGDLRRTLALEPNHFRALEGMGKILNEAGEKKGALKAYEQLLKVYPAIEGGQAAADELKKAVEGQGI